MAFMDFLSGGGSGLISSIIGGGMGLLSNKQMIQAQKEMQQASFEYGEKMAERQNQYEIERMGLQAGMNKDAADYSQQLAKDMWNYTGYANQVKQMKEANINPALMYGGGGGGGQSTSGGSQQGVTALQPMGLQIALQAKQQAAQTELTLAQANKLKQDTLKEATVGMAQGVMDLITSINNNDKIKADKDKIVKEVEVLGANMKKIEEDAALVKENKELAAFQNRVNKILENSTHWENGKEWDFSDVIVTKMYKQFLNENLRLDKEEVELLNEKGIAERLAKDLDKIVQGKLDELSITHKTLSKLQNEIDRQDWELKNDKALGDVLNDIGADSKYSKLLMLVINRLLK